MKKILLIHTGGTLGMAENKPDRTLVPSNFAENIFAHVPQLKLIADIEIKILFVALASLPESHGVA